MPGLDPGIHTLVFGVWMAGSSPAMTRGADGPFFPGFGIILSPEPRGAGNANRRIKIKSIREEVTYTERGEQIRLISAWRAEK